MLDADDIAVLFDFDAEEVTFYHQGYQVTTSALVNITDPAAMPFDGKPQIGGMSLTIPATAITGISPEWKVDVRGKRRPVIDVDDSDRYIWIVMLGDAEEE